MRLVSKITLTIVLLFVVALVSYLQTGLKRKKISKMVAEKTQERLSNKYSVSGIMGSDSVYDPNAIPWGDNANGALSAIKANPHSTNTTSAISESNWTNKANSEALSNRVFKIDEEVRTVGETEIANASPEDTRPPTIMALTVEENQLEEESAGIPVSDIAHDHADSGQISPGREGEILKAMNQRLERLPDDLSEYEKRVTIAEIRDDICEDFSITSLELDSILAKSDANDNSD